MGSSCRAVRSTGLPCFDWTAICTNRRLTHYPIYLASKAAVHDFRGRHRITDPVVEVDWTGVYWRKIQSM